MVHGTNLFFKNIRIRSNFLLKWLTISAKFVSVEDLAVRRMHVDPNRLLFMFDERILIFLKSDSFYLPSVKTPKLAANPLKKTVNRHDMTEAPAFRPFYQRYGWTLCKCSCLILNQHHRWQLSVIKECLFQRSTWCQTCLGIACLYLAISRIHVAGELQYCKY